MTTASPPSALFSPEDLRALRQVTVALERLSQLAIDPDGKLAAAPISDDDLIDIRELCRLLRISLRTAERMIDSGRAPRPIRIGSRLRRWRRGDVVQWIADGCPRVVPSRSSSRGRRR